MIIFGGSQLLFYLSKLFFCEKYLNSIFFNDILKILLKHKKFLIHFNILVEVLVAKVFSVDGSQRTSQASN